MHARPSPSTLRALAIAVVAAASAANADTITVCPDGSCDFTGPEAAVNAAVSGDTIQIAAGNYQLSGPLSLYQKNLVIRGAVDSAGRPATVLDGRNATYHVNALHLSAASAFENLVLTNGRSTQFSAVYMFGCTGTTFRNCSVRGNQGGAIGLNGSSVTMIGCEVLGNSGAPGTSAGGGIYVAGSISLVDCVVSGNAATFSGGGIYLPGGAVANLTRTRVCGNSAPQGAQIGQSPSSTVHDLDGACVMAACGDCPAPPCPADLDGNGSVNGADLGSLLAAWGPCAACPADVDGDGFVSGPDLGALLGSWGTCR